MSEVAPGVIRAHIEAQLCPWCGAGPFKRLASHTKMAHQILGRELRRMAGLPCKASICSPEDSTAARDHLISLPNREEMTRRGNEAAQSVGAIRLAHRASVAKTMAANAAKHERIVELYRQRVLVRDIAAEVGMHPTSVVGVLRRSGATRKALLSERYENEDYAAKFRQSAKQGAAKTVAGRRAKRLARIEEFTALGGDEAALVTVAQRWGISPKSARRFVSQSGVCVSP